MFLTSRQRIIYILLIFLKLDAFRVIVSLVYFSCMRALPFSINKIIIHKKKKK
jgi:hypothetical protein